MAPRGLSPARSETEFDIGSSLLADHGDASDRFLENKRGDARNHRGQVPPGGDDDLDFMAEESGLDDEAIIAEQLAASNRKAAHLKGRTVKKGGGFQAMGLNANLLKAVTRKGFSVPTPIQRKAIPLVLKDHDVVGMARTGSGKTAAFVIPMIEKLKVHSTKVGGRALILSPSRELALQTLHVVKELGRGTDLRCILLVGGDSLEEQFSSMASNPDIIIATPGRFLHLKVEMNLDLSSIKYVVFDEADRLFEMGFAAQLTEILHALPPSRQTLLFSATLPKSLVEFARAGLQDPVLVRLDADNKISPDLQSAFFSVKSSEKEGALLSIIQDVIRVPTSSQLISSSGPTPSKKRKRPDVEEPTKTAPNPYSTIVFVATKHHVEYIGHLLGLAGYAVSYVYGSLDQAARKMQVQAFRSGQTNILVVTDVAARGIDIPVLANVINYDFPSQAKIYVHRVGRTARAGQKGWSYSILRDTDAPYLLDLQLFLGRKLTVGRVTATVGVNFAQEVVVGGLRRDSLQTSCEWVTKTLESDADAAGLRSVTLKGEKLYQRTRNSASAESAKRAKSLVASHAWTELHPLFGDQSDDLEVEREKMLARVGGFRPQESIFEIGARRGGRRANEDAVDAMRKIRSGFESRRQKALSSKPPHAAGLDAGQEPPSTLLHAEDDQADVEAEGDDAAMSTETSDSELDISFSGSSHSKHALREQEDAAEAFRDREHFMSYTPAHHSLSEDKAYGVHSGSNSNFAEAARGATMDLGMDEAAKGFGEARGVMRWDKRHKKYVARQNDDDGSKGRRLVRGESGVKIAASFRSGRYDAWRKANRIGRVSQVGETENQSVPATSGERRFQHKGMKAPKQADKYREDYEKKKKQVATAKERERANEGKREIRSVSDMVKQRRLKAKRREKNARPSKKLRR